MILLLTEPGDAHAGCVERKLQERGAAWLRFDPAEFPKQAEISLECSATGRSRSILRRGGQSFDLGKLKAVWYRRPAPPCVHAEITDAAVRDFVEEESRMFLQDAWHCLACRWLPGQPAAIKRAEFKAAQLGLAGELGFELPPTLVTNSPEDFLEFYRQHNGNIVCKQAGFASLRTLGETFLRYTEVVSKRAVGHARAVRYCPVIFQVYVPKRLELRITVVGKQVFAAEIHSQDSRHTQHDWRRYDFFETVYQPHPLPPALARNCLRLVERLGLCYGAIDMVLTPDGRYVFLEINPNGQYLWIEEATGLPISDAICDLLMNEPDQGEEP